VEADAKQRVREAIGKARRALSDQAQRSAEIVTNLASVGALASADVVMLFDAKPGEPDLAALAASLNERGVRVVQPEARRGAALPIEPGEVDVVVVPGVAFTADGQRLGQGGGWYDRFLAALRDDAVAIGVCFDVQIVDDLPVEAHDRRVHVVVTERRVLTGG
jgi:5-formyltetrahydrofolate cyclo-ligase